MNVLKKSVKSYKTGNPLLPLRRLALRLLKTYFLIILRCGERMTKKGLNWLLDTLKDVLRDYGP